MRLIAVVFVLYSRRLGSKYLFLIACAVFQAGTRAPRSFQCSIIVANTKFEVIGQSKLTLLNSDSAR